MNYKKYSPLLLVFLLLIGFLVLKFSNLSSQENISNPSLKLYFSFDHASLSKDKNFLIPDHSGNKNHGFFYKRRNFLTQGICGKSYYFDGYEDNIFFVKDSISLSPNTTGQFTVSFWINPSTFDFEGTNIDLKSKNRISIVSKLEKLDAYGAEWQFVLYNRTALDPYLKAKRISFYVCNSTGGECAGSNFQDDLKTNEWIHIAGKINGTHSFIYKNGVLRDFDPLSDYGVVMQHTPSLLRLGGIAGGGKFIGAIDELRIFNYSLTDTQISSLFTLPCSELV